MRKRGVTLRTYLAVQVMEQTGCDHILAMEAVASTAIEHPEWDLDQKRTWQEWADYHAELDRVRTNGGAA